MATSAASAIQSARKGRQGGVAVQGNHGTCGQGMGQPTQLTCAVHATLPVTDAAHRLLDALEAHAAAQATGGGAAAAGADLQC